MHIHIVRLSVNDRYQKEWFLLHDLSQWSLWMDFLYLLWCFYKRYIRLKLRGCISPVVLGRLALEVNVSSVKSTDLIYKTRLALNLTWIVNLTSLVWDMDSWHSGRLSALYSVVTGSSSSGRKRSRYTLLMKSNKVETALQWFRISHKGACRIFWWC